MIIFINNYVKYFNRQFIKISYMHKSLMNRFVINKIRIRQLINIVLIFHTRIVSISIPNIIITVTILAYKYQGLCK